MHMDTVKFEVLIDGVPYFVQATPFEFNAETRFNVSFNGGEEVLFVWDSSLKRLSAIGDEAVDVPDALELEIANRLQSKVAG